MWVLDGDGDPSTGFDSFSDGKSCVGCAWPTDKKRFACMTLTQPETVAEARAQAQLSSTCVTDFLRRHDRTESQKRQYAEEYEAYSRAMEDFNVQKGFDQMLIVYQLQIELWFMVTFVLLGRHTPAALLVCFSLYTGTTFNMDYLLEYVLLALSMIACIVAKFRLEHTQMHNFKMLLQTQQEVVCQKDRYIQEKVKRCTAEFKTEQLTNVVEHLRVRGAESIDELTTTVDDSFPLPTKPTDATPQKAPKKKAASVKSAPAAMADPFLNCAPRKVSGDCLPPDAFVWVEGQPLPILAANVAAGRHVLCYDNLARCPRFVEVTDARRLFGDVRWVIVNLEDGSSLTVTASHPMQPVRGEMALAMHVPAADLRAESDCLMVMKLVPVAVASVKHAAAGLDKTRISLSLQQPERHEVFVAQGQTGSRVATGSANAGTDANLLVRRTFVDVETAGCAPRRSNSWPPRGAGEFVEEDGTPPPTAALPNPPSIPRNARERRQKKLSRSTSESALSSVMSSSAPSFITPLFDTTTNPSLMCPSEMSTLSKKLCNGKLKSIGSAEHACGNCTPCLFHNRHLHEDTAPCSKGMACERCHEYHDLLPKAQKRKGSEKRQARKTRRSTETEGALKEASTL